MKKDIRLMTGGGVRTLVFLAVPFILLLLMLLGMKSLSSASLTVRSFPIAVRDEDNTLMSRMLINGLEDIELLDPVIHAKDETDAELLRSGCAAVVTIPEDFFYDLYDMDDIDLRLVLNSSMPFEASLVRSAFSSLMSIIKENQRVQYATARVRYGRLDGLAWQRIKAEYSQRAVEDALTRLDIYELAPLYDEGYDSTKAFFASGIISMLMLFMPLVLLRSVTDELSSGLLARLTLTGISAFEALLSKYVISFIMFILPAAALSFILGIDFFALLPVLWVLFTLSFAFFLFISLAVGNTNAAQLIGITALTAILLLGGAVYPVGVLPDAVRSVSRFLVPGMLLTSVQCLNMGRSIFRSELLFVLLASISLFALSVPLLRARRRV